MNAALTFRVVPHGSCEYEEMVALRDDVLRRPLGLMFTPEQLGQELHDIHLACYVDGELVGCLILVPTTHDDVTMRQVAVRESMQRKGIGQAMVIESERHALARGYTRMILNARLSAVPFYERLGYAVVGPEFVEVTIPHRRMEKMLSE